MTQSQADVIVVNETDITGVSAISCWMWYAFEEDTIMGETVSIEIPKEVLHVTHMTPDELRRELAVHLFQRGRLSFGKARELADMTAWSFQQLLGVRGIPVHYDVEDYEQDLNTLKALGRI